uniref:Receptor-like serine/threonine-protein kinase n=1 Tax=Oryza brachyantha TaxID=4533 RepID=J3MFW8_ORYBR
FAKMKPFARLLLMIVLLLHHHPRLLLQANLTAGSTLRPRYITSPSGDFAFGFRLVSGEDSQFLLAVWCNVNDTQKAVVWYATDPASGSAVTATAQSVFSVALGQLVLAADTTGGGNIWTNSNAAQPNGFVLVLRDSGNLQFLAAGDNSVVWESFRYPTDTLLPGQSMAAGAILRSRRSDADFSSGRFGLFVQNDGNIVLYLMNLAGGGNADSSKAYGATRTQQPGNTPDGNTTLFFDSTGSIYYQIKNGSLHELTPPMANSTAGSYQRAPLDPDGIVRVYVRPRNSAANASWTVAGLFPTTGYGMSTRALDGFCGPNSYCVSGSGAGDRLDCACPTGYTFVDTKLRYLGCRPVFAPQSCDVEANSSAEFRITRLPNTTWTASPYMVYPRTAEEQCADMCLSDCFCVAALFESDATLCTKMALLAGSGQQGRHVTAKVLIKVRTSSPPAPPSRRRLPLLPYILLGCSVLLLLAAAAWLLLQHRRIRRSNTDHDTVRVFTRRELHRATNGFQRLLGRGGFGEVYHGVAKSVHPHDIAVKRLVTSNEYSEREFANEVHSIGRIHHRNLVRMVGYCKEREQRMLVFEFMPSGSLRSFLFRRPRPPWSWALGIAKGIEYLHEGCTSPIIHCDIKPDNILLDDKNNPKITDFGIARLLGDQQLHTTVTDVRGTRGYIAPEWFHSERRIDTKVDVYSFGVVLLEMICCRRCQDPVSGHGEDGGGDSVTLFGWAGRLIKHNRVAVLPRSDDDTAAADLERVERFARVAFLCIERNPSLRPTMHQVVQMLEGVIQVHALPDLPSFADASP